MRRNEIVGIVARGTVYIALGLALGHGLGISAAHAQTPSAPVAPAPAVTPTAPAAPPVATPPPACTVRICFSPDHCDQEVIDTVKKAQKKHRVMIYTLSDPGIAGTLIANKNKGEDVRLIVDHSEATSVTYEQQLLKQIEEAGIPVRQNKHKGVMHMKVSIVDDQTVATGSYNYTQSATRLNDENLVVFENCPGVAQLYSMEFERCWADDTRFEWLYNPNPTSVPDAGSSATTRDLGSRGGRADGGSK